MRHRQKILIIEKDDFLREILGNTLHKKGGYLFSAFCLKDGLEDVKGHRIDTIILGTSCDGYKGKETLSYIRKHLPDSSPYFFIINDTGASLDFVPEDQQIMTKDLSIEAILQKIPV